MNVSRAGIGLAALSAVGLVLCGCENGGSSVGSGQQKISGNVVSVSVGRSAKAFAKSAVSGVNVSLSGTDIASSTDSGGQFVLSGVPAGEYSLIFDQGDVSGSFDVDVPEGHDVNIQDVTISSDGTVGVGALQISETPGYSEGSPGSNDPGTTPEPRPPASGDNDNWDKLVCADCHDKAYPAMFGYVKCASCGNDTEFPLTLCYACAERLRKCAVCQKAMVTK